MERPHPWHLMLGPALAGYIGCVYHLGNSGRTMNTAFLPAKSIAPMDTWGIVFLLGAVMLTLSIISQSSRAIATTFWFGGLMYAWWSAAFLLGGLSDPSASLIIWTLYGLISVFHFIVAVRIWRTR